MTARPNETFSCLLCGTTTPMPHVCPVFALPLSPPEEERPGMDENDVVQILCRVFADAMDEGGTYEQWQAWYDPTQWFHRSRAVGAFLYQRVQMIRDERDAARSALKDSYNRAYDLALVLNVERPSESDRAQPMRFTEREIL